MREPNLLLKEYLNAEWLGAHWLDISNRSRIFCSKMQTPSLVAFVLFLFDDISLFSKQIAKGNARRGNREER